MTLYDSYDEYNIDMDILGKVVSIPQLSRDELKDVVFRELQETHPVPKLEDERYKLSKPVDEDYQIQVENYKQEFEDEDLSVDDLAEGEDPYTLGTGSEDLYAVDDIYGLDLNIFSSPFSESEVEQAISDIESFLHQKVEKFKQNKAEYEKRNELSVEEVRAMYSRQAQVKEEPKETEGTPYEDEEMIDTFSSSGVETVEDDEEPYFISESDAPYIRVEVINAEDLYISEPDTPYIEVESEVYFIQEPSIPCIEEVFIPEPDILFIESQGIVPDADMNEISSTSINNNAEFFVQEEDISFINVYSSEESGYKESSDDTGDYTVEEDLDEEESDDDMGYEEDSDDSVDEGDSDNDMGYEEDSDDESDEGYSSYDESDDSEESYNTESDEEDDYSTESDEEEDSEDYSTESDDEEDSDDESFNIEEDDSDDFSTDQDESDDDSSTDSDDEEVHNIEGTEEEDDIEPALAPPPQVKKSIKESKGSDTLNPRQVSEGSDLEDSFMDKPLAKGTKLTQSTRDREIKNPPRDLVDFLRLYPRTQYSIAVKYYGEKEVKRQIRMGRVYRNGKYLVI